MKELQDIARLSDRFISVELVDESLFDWNVKLHQVDKDSVLWQDMKETNTEYILLNLTFPDNFPFSPPFMRVLSPRLENGYVLDGGAICMELLTPRGWSSAYTVEAVMRQFAASLVKGQVGGMWLPPRVWGAGVCAALRVATPKGGGTNLGWDQARGSPQGTGVTGGQEGEHLSLPGPSQDSRGAGQHGGARSRGRHHALLCVSCHSAWPAGMWHRDKAQGPKARGAQDWSPPPPALLRLVGHACWPPYLLAFMLHGLHACWPPQ